jgi:hypothetical protein
MCVTTIHGGLNINSVPDSVTFTIDFRNIPSNSHEDFRKAIRTTLGGKAEITTVADLPVFSTAADDPALAPVVAAYERLFGRAPVTARRALLHRRVGADAGIGRGTDQRSSPWRNCYAATPPIYESEFLGFSYGFRPKRSQHQAPLADPHVRP